MDFKLVYSGGHNDVYCNGSIHLRLLGENCGTCKTGLPGNTSMPEVEGPFLCDCEKWKKPE